MRLTSVSSPIAASMLGGRAGGRASMAAIGTKTVGQARRLRLSWLDFALTPAGYPSGQRGLTENRVATPSKVRILLPPLVAGDLRSPDGPRCRAPRPPSPAATPWTSLRATVRCWPNTAAPPAKMLDLNRYGTAQFGECHEVDDHDHLIRPEDRVSAAMPIP